MMFQHQKKLVSDLGNDKLSTRSLILIHKKYFLSFLSFSIPSSCMTLRITILLLFTQLWLQNSEPPTNICFLLRVFSPSGPDTEFPPCSGFRIQHCSGVNRRGQHSTVHGCRVPSSTDYPCSGDTDSQRSSTEPPLCADTVQNSCPVRSSGSHRTIYFSYFGCTGSFLQCVGLNAP